MMMERTAMAEQKQTPIVAGEIEIRVQVLVTATLK
jgi:uncharacterized protein YggE